MGGGILVVASAKGRLLRQLMLLVWKPKTHRNRLVGQWNGSVFKYAYRMLWGHALCPSLTMRFKHLSKDRPTSYATNMERLIMVLCPLRLQVSLVPSIIALRLRWSWINSMQQSSCLSLMYCVCVLIHTLLNRCTHLPHWSSNRDSEGTSFAVPAVTPFELESQTDDNTTPTNPQKIAGQNNRQADDDEAGGSMSSNTKKAGVEIKLEKDP